MVIEFFPRRKWKIGFYDEIYARKPAPAGFNETLNIETIPWSKIYKQHKLLYLNSMSLEVKQLHLHEIAARKIEF